MKYCALIIFCMMIVSFISCKKNEISGLVAKYSFTGNSNDMRGYNNGTPQGVVLSVDRFGEENSAYRFDGVSDAITASVTGMPATNSTQSISLWFKIDTIPTFKHDLDAHNMISLVDTNDGVGIQYGFRASGYKSLGLDVWYWGGRTVMESVQPAINQWHHCVYTFDGKRHLFFLDGKKVAESTVQPQTGTPDMLMLGNYPGGDQYFAGCIDDVRIYNRPLSKAEVQIIYTEKE